MGLACGAPAAAQKVEREFGISRDEVPAPVFAFLDSAFAGADLRRERYYADVGAPADTVIEAKFLAGDRRYSVEFDPSGRWLNTEVEVAVRDVPTAVWAEACASWSRRYSRFRIARVQLHRGRGGEAYYEVEVRTRRDFEWDRYEVAIAPDGRLLREELVELAPGHLDRW